MSTQGTLLVVDDNAVNLELISGFLRSAGYRVLVAADGESALEQARLARPDLVLMDVLLPGMSGFDAARALRQQSETIDTPIIFLTALSRTSDKIEGFRAGGVDYLTKPLQFEEVLARVQVHLQLRDLRAQVEQHNGELKERDKRRDRMLSIIAHDLKSPMGDMAQSLRMLEGLDPADPLFNELRTALRDRAERMNEFLATLLDWGELQVRSKLMETETFAVDDAIQGTLSLLSERISHKGLVVEVRDEGTGLVSLNRTALQMVLSNLLTNAVKFSSAGSRIVVEAGVEDGRLTVAVEDEGVGMGKDDIDRLFRSGRRVQRTGTDGESGTGLGLLLSQDLISRMNGTIGVESEPGGGSRFTVSLPTGVVPDE